jgi:CRP/FNR family cyclic AMP-dependent transcriptional regulator
MADSRLADRVTLLRGGWLFSECTDDELERVAALAHPVHVPQGQVIVREGEPGDEFYVVVDGTTRVTLEDAPIADIGPCSFFGEMALLDGGERTATITADGELRCATMTAWDFKSFVIGNPKVAWAMLQTLAQRVRTSRSM